MRRLFCLALVLLVATISQAQGKKLEFKDGKWQTVDALLTFTVVGSYVNRHGCEATIEDSSTHAQYFVKQLAMFSCYVLSSGETYPGKIVRHNVLASYDEIVLMETDKGKTKSVRYELLQEYH